MLSSLRGLLWANKAFTRLEIYQSQSMLWNLRAFSSASVPFQRKKKHFWKYLRHFHCFSAFENITPRNVKWNCKDKLGGSELEQQVIWTFPCSKKQSSSGKCYMWIWDFNEKSVIPPRKLRLNMSAHLW